MAMLVITRPQLAQLNPNEQHLASNGFRRDHFTGIEKLAIYVRNTR